MKILTNHTWLETERAMLLESVRFMRIYEDYPVIRIESQLCT